MDGKHGSPRESPPGPTSSGLSLEEMERWDALLPRPEALARAYPGLSYEDREDAIQESRIALWMALPRFALDGSAKPMTFAWRVINRKAIDSLRKQRPYEPLLNDDQWAEEGKEVPHELLDWTYSPEQTVERKELQEVVQQEISRLPRNFREVIDLRYLQDRSYREIANALGIPIGTVKTRLFRAHGLLRDRLRPYVEGRMC